MKNSLLLIFFVCVFTTQRGWASESSRPVLNLATSNVTVLANGTLDLECAGEETLHWIFPSEWTSEISSQAAVSESFDPSRIKSHVITLRLENIPHQFTGWFVCAYQKGPQPTVDGLYLEDSRSTAVYVYVYDEDHLFTPLRKEYNFIMLVAFSSRPLVIPCKPTKPDIKVTFVNTESPDEEVEGLQFDPRRGFVVQHPWSVHDGHFECRAEYAGKNDSKMVILRFHREMTRVPEPVVDMKGARHPWLNGSFHLICNTLTDGNTLVELSWEWPVGAQNVIVLEKNMSQKVLGSGDVLRQVSRRLEVSRATSQHSGTYTCSAVTPNGRAVQRVEVLIHDHPKTSFVNLTSHLQSTLEVNSSSPELKLVVEVDYHHPLSGTSSPEMQATWFKNGLLLDEQHRITSTFFHGHQVVLRISPVAWRDSGNYTLVVTVGGPDGPKANWSIAVYVKFKPILYISAPNFFVLNHDYTVNCAAWGYPLPKIWWWWKACANGTSDCDEDWTDLDNQEKNPGNSAVIAAPMVKAYDKVSRNFTLVANTFGYYKCQSASDSFESQQKVFKFVIVEDSGGIGMLGRPPGEVIEGQEVSITCRASKVIFSNLSWTRHTRTNPERRVTSDANIGVEILETETPYSLVSTLTFRSLQKKHGGQYSCNASSSVNASLSARLTRTVDVKERTPPHFEDPTVPLFQSIEMDSAKTLEVSCEHQGGVPAPNVTWFKDGRPFTSSSADGIEFPNDVTLKITRVLEEDAGVYTCRVGNGVGAALARNFSLAVKPAEPVEADMNKWVYVGVFTVLAPLLLGVIIALILKTCRERREQQEQDFLEKCLFEKGQMTLLNPEMSLDEQVDLLPYQRKWEFPKDRLKLGRVIGQGAFGRVVRADAIGMNDAESHTTVAVKMLKERADRVQRRALVAELKILIHLGSHLNIVNLLGAVTKNLARGELMVIVEYCRFGNLRNYLLRHRATFKDLLDPITGRLECSMMSDTDEEDYLVPLALNGFSNPTYRESKSRLPDMKLNYAHLQHSHTSLTEDFTAPCASPISNGSNHWDLATDLDSGSSKQRSRLASEGTLPKKVITTRDLLCFSFQCARGMEYLASRKLIHRDLAARNVLLADDNVVKICDFGLAKDCYKYDTYVKKNDGPLPIKWMAVESIGEKVYTTKSDVWSFGILLWEFFTLGGNPYPGIELDEDFYRKLKSGHRMEKPKYAPEDVYDLMKNCWQEDPSHRPNFEALEDALGSLLESGVKQYYLELNTPYLQLNFQNPPVDYLTMGKTEDDQSVTYQNLDHCVDFYDNISNGRPVDGEGPAPLQPLEVVPMIQMDSFREKKMGRESLLPPRSISEDPDSSDLTIESGLCPPSEDVENELKEDVISATFELNLSLDSQGDHNRSEEDYLTMGKVHLERFHKGNISLRSAASSGFHSDPETTPEVVASSPPPSYSLVMKTPT